MCMALVTSINMAGGACKCGVGSLVHRRKFDRSHSDVPFCALQRWCFLHLGKTYATTKRMLGMPKDLAWLERSAFRFAVVNLSATRKYVQVALVQASLPTRTNQLHVNPRDSISGFLQSRFTNNEQKIEQMQCHSRGLVSSVQQFPTSYESTHACTHAILGLYSTTWHKRMPHDSPFLSVGHSVARMSHQR